MRLEIVREGVFIPGDNWLIEPGAIQWEDDGRIMATYGADWNRVDNFIGKVGDIRREDDGAITAEIEPKDQQIADCIFGFEDPTHPSGRREAFIEPFIYATQVVEKYEGGVRHIFGCRLRAVTFFLKPPYGANPGVSI